MQRTRSKSSPKTTRSSPNRKSDFGRLAARYDALRDVEPRRLDELYELLVREGDLRGRRVLDVGCGTGTLAAWLAERAAAKVWGVDESPEMLDVARAKVPNGVGLKQGRAEELPFKEGWFDRVLFVLSVHLVDRPRAFGEAHRVLAPGGKVAVVTFSPAHFAGFYLNRLFPSILEIDLARFPSPEALADELAGSGVTVTCLCPGPTHTEFAAAAGMREGKSFSVGGRLGARAVAEAGVRGMVRGKRLVVPGFRNRLLLFAERFLPRRAVVAVVRWMQERRR
jgi:ubiquinone/menaquinone biosynthesis C-methylase UbiE